MVKKNILYICAFGISLSLSLSLSLETNVMAAKPKIAQRPMEDFFGSKSPKVVFTPHKKPKSRKAKDPAYSEAVRYINGFGGHHKGLSPAEIAFIQKNI